MPQTGNPAGDIEGYKGRKQGRLPRAGAAYLRGGSYRSFKSRPRATAWTRLCTSSLP
jgi:hypothetical protein